MRLSRKLAQLALVLGGALGSQAGCSSSSTPPAFTDDGGVDGDATEEPPPVLGADAQIEGSISNEGGYNDGTPNVEGGCVPDAGGTPLVQHICVKYGGDTNECDGHHDLVGFPLNGTGGNGFDDNCNGLVDEGCACPAPGQTKTCYLVPESQQLGGVPLGWCAQNSKGTVDCLQLNTEATPTWSGQCRGAQPPFPDDFCAPGDFNCDGVQENSSTMDCSCKPGSVQCPTTPIQTIPYPPPTMLPTKVDAAGWFANPGQVSQATNWKWTLRGGDCDNILPHPTFGIYATQDGSGSPLGMENDTLGPSGKEHGIIATAPTITSSFYPAFSLSGDYLLQGEFDLDGKHYSCLEKIQVRAPGIRAEACWDTEGSDVDLDIHMAKSTGFTQCPTSHGWSDTCSGEDCYYGNCANASGSQISWYPSSSSSACVGWGSEATGPCNNPRLDRDANGISGTCDPTVTNPNSSASAGIFCGPENINVDAPADGDKYAVAVKNFRSGPASKTHVNVYCNGERVLSSGYNPVTGNDFPQLVTSGGDFDGDLWKVALIQTNVNGTTVTCDVHPTQSMNPHAATDGSNAYCVDNAQTDTTQCTHFLAYGGFAPLDANAMCFH